MNPKTATIDKGDAEAVDLVFTVSSTAPGNEITGLKIGSTAVNEANYEIDSVNPLKLTIDATYLQGLAVGDKVFTIILDRGDDVVVTVTVTQE